MAELQVSRRFVAEQENSWQIGTYLCSLALWQSFLSLIGSLQNGTMICMMSVRACCEFCSVVGPRVSLAAAGRPAVECGNSCWQSLRLRTREAEQEALDGPLPV
jgi:hypothetical protein